MARAAGALTPRFKNHVQESYSRKGAFNSWRLSVTVKKTVKICDDDLSLSLHRKNNQREMRESVRAYLSANRLHIRPSYRLFGDGPSALLVKRERVNRVRQMGRITDADLIQSRRFAKRR